MVGVAVRAMDPCFVSSHDHRQHPRPTVPRKRAQKEGKCLENAYHSGQDFDRAEIIQTTGA